MSEHVTITDEGGVVTARLAKPPANPLGPDLIAALHAAVDHFEAVDGRVLVVASDTPGFFAAGADIKHMGGLDADGFAAYGDELRGAIERVAGIDGVSIAAIDGRALGGGLELALACHLRVISPAARLGVPEVKLGLIPGAGGTQRLPRAVGAARALEITLSAREVEADEALAIGLAHRLVPGDELDAAVAKLAASLARGSAPALRATIACCEAAGRLPLEEGLAYEAAAINTLMRGTDAPEGIRAFVERRRPEFA